MLAASISEFEFPINCESCFSPQTGSHLGPGPLLHPGELGRRVRGPLAVDDLGEQPLPEHGALVEDALLPQVGLVGAHLVPGDDGHLVARRLALDLGRGPHQDEGVQEVGLDAGGRERRVVRLEEHHADDVVADVPLALELWASNTPRQTEALSTNTRREDRGSPGSPST